MTLTPKRRTDLLAFGVIAFMSVAFVAMMMVFALSIERSTSGTFPMGYVLLTIIMPIVVFILMEHITKSTVARIYAHHRMREERMVKKVDSPKDPLVTWLSILFSKED
mgnify:CR=1 FL=1